MAEAENKAYVCALPRRADPEPLTPEGGVPAPLLRGGVARRVLSINLLPFASSTASHTLHQES